MCSTSDTLVAKQVDGHSGSRSICRCRMDEEPQSTFETQLTRTLDCKDALLTAALYYKAYNVSGGSRRVSAQRVSVSDNSARGSIQGTPCLTALVVDSHVRQPSLGTARCG